MLTAQNSRTVVVMAEGMGTFSPRMPALRQQRLWWIQKGACETCPHGHVLSSRGLRRKELSTAGMRHATHTTCNPHQNQQERMQNA